MNKNKGFTLVEMTVTLVIFGALLLLIVNINQEMNYNQAVRLGAGGVVDLVETSSKVLNNNYNNLINLQNGNTDPNTNITMGKSIEFNNIVTNLTKGKVYSTQKPYLFVTKCSLLPTQLQIAENCTYNPSNLNNGDLVAYLILPMSDSVVFNKPKNALVVAQPWGDSATLVQKTASGYDVVRSKFSDNIDNANLAKYVMATYPAQVNNLNSFVLIDLNQFAPFAGGTVYSNNSVTNDTNVGLNRSSGTTTSQDSTGHISMSYNFTTESGVNNYIKFGSDAFLRAGRVLDVNGHQIILTNQVIKAPISLTSEARSDTNLITNVNGVLYLNGQQGNVTH